MNIFKKIIFFVVISIYTVIPVFSETEISFMQTSVLKFSGEMNKASLFNSSIGLNWSDAYIGKITSDPAHFGVGISAGFTTIDFNTILNIMYAFDMELPLADKIDFFDDTGYFIPNYTLDVRIGGFGIPFDIGVKFGFLPHKFVGMFSPNDDDATMQNMLIGGDIRFALLNRKSCRLKISTGLGFNFMTGEISVVLPDFKLVHTKSDGTKNNLLNLTTPKVDVLWRTMNIELKAQASVPCKFITPYLGFKGGFSWSQSGYRVTSALTDGEVAELSKYDFTRVSKTGFETIIDEKDIWERFNAQAFGGFSINLFYVRLDFTGMYEILGKNFGGTFGIRFQL